MQKRPSSSTSGNFQKIGRNLQILESKFAYWDTSPSGFHQKVVEASLFGRFLPKNCILQGESFFGWNPNIFLLNPNQYGL